MTGEKIKKILGIWKNKFLIKLILLSVIVVFAVFGWETGNVLLEKTRFKYQEFNKEKALIEEYKNKLQIFLNKESELKVIRRTLVVTYGLNKYEAKYYSIIIYDVSNKRNVPWQLFPALMRVESNFNPSASSNKKAKGLTQVLNGTAEEVCEKLGIEFEGNKTMWNDILNMVIGFNYLSDGIKSKEDAEIKHGIKRYLGGPDYKKSVKFKDHIIGYKTTVWDEYIRLCYISKGVKAEIEEQKTSEVIGEL